MTLKTSISTLGLLVAALSLVPANGEAQTPGFRATHMAVEYGGSMRPMKDTYRVGGYLWEGQGANVTNITLVECDISNPRNCKSHNLAPSDVRWSVQQEGNSEVTAIYSTNWFCLETGLSVYDQQQAQLFRCPVGRGASLLTYLTSVGQLVSYDTTATIPEGTSMRVRAEIASWTPGLSGYTGTYTDYLVEIQDRFDFKIGMNQDLLATYGVSYAYIDFGYGPYYNGVTYSSKCTGRISNGGQSAVLRFEDQNGKPVTATGEFNRITLYRPDLRTLQKGAQLELDCTVVENKTGFSRRQIYRETKY